MKNPKFSHAFEVVGDLPPSLAPLKKLAANFRWTWDHGAREVFRAIDKDLWDACEHNPVLFLNRIPRSRLERLADDALFIARLEHAVSELESYLTAETWFDRHFPGLREKTQIAYFCFEFGISEGLPIYSGGLGILAGDHLKAASDLGIPLVAVGLLYNRGYFRQRLNHDGWQEEIYPEYDFYQMPLTLKRNPDETPIRIDVEFPDRVVSCQVWEAHVGRIKLYLLDSNVLENQPHDQGITDSLYGGDEEMRIRQEMILGIGGMKALKALGIKPTACHMNEGHAAFLSIERIRQYMEENNCDFRTARQVVVSGNVFTTHTPVPAGFDLFQPALLERYMGRSVAATGLPFSEFLKLGRSDENNQSEPFNMAILAMENADWVNGVSELHAKVTRTMFNSRWPGYPEDEVPVEAITNGIHTTTWTSQRMSNLLDEHLGIAWRRNPEDVSVWDGIDAIPDEDLWAVLENQRGDLVRFVRRRMQKELERYTIGREMFGSVANILDPRILTIGFARRFATYKRGSLMLNDRDRLKQILFHAERPVQIVIAGKSHPRDDGGKRIMQDLWNFINREGARARMVFLEDYDMRVARMLVQGVDLWLNNPRRPYEASGTSGMKVVPNGGLNLSILDGWWDEGYEPGVGWAIGDRGDDSTDSGHQDWLDSRALYNLIEGDIAPTFYHRVDHGIPRDWIRMVKRSIKTHAPRFSTARMVHDYTSRFYVPASEMYTRLSANNQEKAKVALAWRDRVRASWPDVHIEKVTNDAGVSNAMGKTITVRAHVRLGALPPSDIRVQAVVGKVGPNRELLSTRVEDLKYVGFEDNTHIFESPVVCDLPGHQGFTIRVVPYHEDVSIPSELNIIAWE